jgi:two-component sensor histidine kinase
MRVMTRLRYAIRARPNPVVKAAIVILAVALPTLARWFLVHNYYGAPFVLYFPVILLIAIIIGWRWAAIAAVASGGVAIWLFWPASFQIVGPQQIAVMTMFTISATTMIAIGQLLRDAVLTIDAQARQSEEFNRELQHRTKNSIQMMRALASQASKATDPAEFYKTLGGRLAALAKANELLRFGALEACDINELMRATIAPFNAAQISFSGPSVRISRDGCTPLMMALHELGTNASKYGALSSEHGRVDIDWRSPEDGGTIEIVWRESGGPPVSEPTRRGIGARLLTANGDLHRIALDYLESGVICELSVGRG